MNDSLTRKEPATKKVEKKKIISQIESTTDSAFTVIVMIKIW